MKVRVFVLSAVIASVMGSLSAHYVGFITPGIAGFQHSIELVTMAQPVRGIDGGCGDRKSTRLNSSH